MSLQEKINYIKNELLKVSNNSFYIAAFSGGKDSHVMLDILLKTLKENNLNNPVYILISRTKSEYPEFEEYLNKALSNLKEYLKKENMNNVEIIEAEPLLERRFLFLITGKGYPVPRNSMRWCNLKLKLDVMKKIENELVKKHRTMIPVKIVGTRKEEGQRRAQKIEEFHLKVTDGILSMSPIKDLKVEDVWEYIDKHLSFNRDLLLKLYNNIQLDYSNSIRQGCWFCPLIKEDSFLKNNYSPIESFRLFLREYAIKPNTRYEISRRFTKEVAGPYKMHIREKFFERLIEELSKINNPLDFISLEEIIYIQKEHIKEGWLTLNIFKKYLKIDNNKEINSFITSVDSINVLFPRFKEIQKYTLFKDVKASDFCIGVAKRILFKENIHYGYKFKEITKPVEELKIEDKLKEEYLSLLKNKEKTKIDLKRNLLELATNIMHNYLYYLHKFNSL